MPTTWVIFAVTYWDLGDNLRHLDDKLRLTRLDLCSPTSSHA